LKRNRSHTQTHNKNNTAYDTTRAAAPQMTTPRLKKKSPLEPGRVLTLFLVHLELLRIQ